MPKIKYLVGVKLVFYVAEGKWVRQTVNKSKTVGKPLKSWQISCTSLKVKCILNYCLAIRVHVFARTCCCRASRSPTITTAALSGAARLGLVANCGYGKPVFSQGTGVVFFVFPSWKTLKKNIYNLINGNFMTNRRKNNKLIKKN